MVLRFFWQVLFTGSHEGVVTRWDVATGCNERIAGRGHGNMMNGMVQVGDAIFTCGIDDSVKQIDTLTGRFVDGVDIKLASQPRGIPASAAATIVVPCEKEVRVLFSFM